MSAASRGRRPPAPRRRSAKAKLGPSNDDSPAVQVEMRAAELEAWIAVDELHVSDEFEPMEKDGWCMWVRNADEVGPAVEAGWLAAESYTAGSPERADAWAWDISRPIAEQLAETAALDAQADIEETRAAANTAALVAELDAKGPAYDAINAAFDAEDDAATDALVEHAEHLRAKEQL